MPDGTRSLNANQRRAAQAAAIEHEQRRGWSRGYPRDPMIDETFRTKRLVLQAVREFRAKHPFRIGPVEFEAAAEILAAQICLAHCVDAPRLSVGSAMSSFGGGGFYSASEHTIGLSGNLSVITLLHEIYHACGYGEHGAVYYSVNLFRRFFPVSFSRLITSGHMLVRDPNRGHARRSMGERVRLATDPAFTPPDPGRDA